MYCCNLFDALLMAAANQHCVDAREKVAESISYFGVIFIAFLSKKTQKFGEVPCNSMYYLRALM